MKRIEVVAAIIFHDERILATQRGYGELKGLWEFPGGKIETSETPVQALKREIQEELNLDIIVDELFDVVEWDYPHFHLSMSCFLCRKDCSELQIIEHSDARWLLVSELQQVEWLPADLEIVQKLQMRYNII